MRRQIISLNLYKWDNNDIRRLTKGEQIPLPSWARSSRRMRNEAIQLILEEYQAVIWSEEDALALNLFLQRENAYDHIRGLSFSTICSLRDTHLVTKCSDWDLLALSRVVRWSSSSAIYRSTKF